MYIYARHTHKKWQFHKVPFLSTISYHIPSQIQFIFVSCNFLSHALVWSQILNPMWDSHSGNSPHSTSIRFFSASAATGYIIRVFTRISNFFHLLTHCIFFVIRKEPSGFFTSFSYVFGFCRYTNIAVTSEWRRSPILWRSASESSAFKTVS